MAAAGPGRMRRKPAQGLRVSTTPPSATRRGSPCAGLDAVIDISHNVTVTDFAAVRRSNILGRHPQGERRRRLVRSVLRQRRRQAEAAGLLWGGYHFGTRQYSGERAGGGLPVGLPAGAGDGDGARSRAQRRQPGATPCSSPRPRPSCGRSSRRPDGCRWSTPIRSGPTARDMAAAASAWSDRSVRAPYWRAATCGWPTIASIPKCPTPGPIRAGASGSTSPTRASRHRLRRRAPRRRRRRPLRPQPVRRRRGRALPFLEGRRRRV